MCGIAGILKQDSEQQVASMMAAMKHRGPDGDGLYQNDQYTLGHVRLSIIDLVGGGQPMVHEASDSQIVFNGEIYNHLKLRRQIGAENFQTHSDTEVILQLHQSQSPPEAWVGRLDGMFAFAITDPSGFTLARDPLGIKPLYIGKQDSRLVFASEIKSLLAASDEIREFPPGYVYTSQQGLQRYYQLPTPGEETITADEARQEVRRLLEAAVAKRLLADVPVGVFLSGGLDSSLIAALARRHKHPLDSFSVGTEDSPDRQYALEVAEFLGTRHHDYCYSLPQALAVLPEVIYYLESFDCALVRSAIANYFLARLAAEQVKVALSGEGADELFAGYRYLKPLAGAALNQELHGITQALHNTNLQRCDRMSMAHGLEVRVPFLDVALVDYAFRLPTELKLFGPQQTEKWILRKVAEQLLPKNIVWRKKMKFAVGAGLGDKLARYAEAQISDTAFRQEREIGEGRRLRSKEELFYFRIFRQTFPTDKLLPLLGQSRSI